MLYLQMPEKRPQYRGDRDHKAFLTPLKDHVGRREDLWAALKAAAGEHFVLEEASISDVLRDTHSSSSSSSSSSSRSSRSSSGSSGGNSGSAWMEACRTKFVGLDGKAVPPPPGRHDDTTLA
ncbi:unnamed protein product [Ectocarpus sp. 4 AP-2014]